MPQREIPTEKVFLYQDSESSMLLETSTCHYPYYFYYYRNRLWKRSGSVLLVVVSSRVDFHATEADGPPPTIGFE
jgi:hypothetical protein